MNGEIFFHKKDYVHQRISLAFKQHTQSKHAITRCLPTYLGEKLDEVFYMKSYYMKNK
jgi:hypothetical protein